MTFAQIKRGTLYFNYETVHQRKDGSPVWLNFITVVLYDDQGEVVGTSGTAQDITAHKKAEATRSEKEKRLIAAERVAHLGNWTYEVTTGRILWSDELYRIFGLEPGSSVITYETLSNMIHPEDRARHDDYLARMLALTSDSPAVPKLEYRLVQPNGTGRSVEVFLEAEFNAQHTPARFFGTVQDITERKRAEAALHDSEMRFRMVLESVALIGLILDINGRITLCSDYLLTLTGWRREEVLGSDWFEQFLPPEVRGNVRKNIFLHTLTTGDLAKHYENEIVTRQGERRLIAWSNVLIRDATGRITNIASLGEDITERKKTEHALQALVQGTATVGGMFFVSLVRELAAVLQIRYAFVGRLLPGNPERVRTLAVWAVDRPGDNFDYTLAGTPCQNVVGKELCHYPTWVAEQFPEDKMLTAMGVHAYLGVPLFANDGRPLGLLAVLHDKELPLPQITRDLLLIFANRATAELQQLEVEETLRQSEMRFRRIMESDMIGMIF